MDKRFYIENRRKVAAHMTEKEAMLFFSGEPVRKTADEDFPFFTNRNSLYLTGIKQERSVLLLQKYGDLISERLFVTKPNFEREIWTGRRFTDEEINEISRIGQVEDMEEWSEALNELLSFQHVTTLWLCFDALPGTCAQDKCAPEHSYDSEREFARHIRKRHPHLALKNSYPLLAKMRKIKTPQEIDAIHNAMQITEAGIRRLMRVAKPGVMEYELEAEFNSELAAHGQRHTAFPSIIAGGERIFICIMQTLCLSSPMAS